MNSENKDMEIEQLVSTYGLITIERILNRYQIRLTPEKLAILIKNHFSFYRYILQIPLKNVLNGIVIQQAHDYFVYVQKLYIDYLLSADNAAEEDAPGAAIRESLEEERKRLVEQGESFHQLERDQDAFIAKSQKFMFGLINDWHGELETAIRSLQKTIKNFNPETDLKPNLIRQSIEHALLNCDLKSAPSEINSLFIEKVNEVLQLRLAADLEEKLANDLAKFMQFSLHIDEKLSDFYPDLTTLNERARAYRQEMYNSVLRAIPLIKLLPSYRIDPKQDLINRELLYFDKTIGE